MNHRIGFLAAPLLCLSAVPADAQVIDFWMQCTAGAIRACASVQASSINYVDSFGILRSDLVFRVSNPQGLLGYEYGTTGLRSISASNMTYVTGAAWEGGMGSHIGSEGSVYTGSSIDTPNLSRPGDGSLTVAWHFDRNGQLFGCDVPPDATFYTGGYDATCGGSVTYLIPLRQDHLSFSQSTSLTLHWNRWDGTEHAGSVSCTTGVDCVMVTPEPLTIMLLGTGLLGIAGAGLVRGRRRPGHSGISM